MKRLLILALLLGIPSLGYGCLWDYDTLAQERGRFPGAANIMVGKYLRHGPDFYDWRIQDRQAKLKQDPTRLDWYDDLAVALAKRNRLQEANAILDEKDRISPGLYTTLANRATFAIYAGNLDEAEALIEQALQINPDAHFGREKYQLRLVQYMKTQKPWQSSTEGGLLTFLLALSEEKKIDKTPISKD